MAQIRQVGLVWKGLLGRQKGVVKKPCSVCAGKKIGRLRVVWELPGSVEHVCIQNGCLKRVVGDGVIGDDPTGAGKIRKNGVVVRSCSFCGAVATGGVWVWKVFASSQAVVDLARMSGVEVTNGTVPKDQEVILCVECFRKRIDIAKSELEQELQSTSE